MAHNSHYDQHVETQALQQMSARPVNGALPSISEDEAIADADEPPDERRQTFIKSKPTTTGRKQSLLTKALHTDTEDDESVQSHALGRDASRASTCSTTSMVSSGGFTSDAGFTSPGTRASTPGSPPPSFFSLSHKPTVRVSPPIKETSDANHQSDNTPRQASPTVEEPNVEAKLGRKRCITFACGRKASPKPAESPKTLQIVSPAPQKRPCAIKFMCPSKAFAEKKDKSSKISRHLSPAPHAIRARSPARDKPHRDSDSTIKTESPKSTRKSARVPPPAHVRHASNDSVSEKGEAMRFHEFATSEEEKEDWLEESTCHRARLTVTDTLKRENEIRQLGSEAEEEAIEEEEAEVESEEESEDDNTDDGFQTDDEDGFAESDNESDGDSDYEWWTYRPSPIPDGMVVPLDHPFLPRKQRTNSMSSMNSASSRPRSAKSSPSLDGKQKRTRPVVIRPGTPELPDSTDFICGTLDEDRPLEQAYISCKKQREAAKRRTIAQDIDPTFPTSDPEMDSDVEDVKVNIVDESDHFIHGQPENIDGSGPRGRRQSKDLRAAVSPNRPSSPAPILKRSQFHRSPAPRALFDHSPERRPSPHPRGRLESPPPSRTGSPAAIPRQRPLLAHRPRLTFTSSLPRSPCPFARRPLGGDANSSTPLRADTSADDAPNDKPYSRGAIDIIQGLENKRLRRRQRFYEKYCRKERTAKERRPQPGKGAQRMRQIGIECAEYRGKRVLSL